MDQWLERLALFLGLSTKDIGQIGGGKTTKTGRLDVAVIQSLIRKGEVKDMVAEYGQVIVDECHHVSAFRMDRLQSARTWLKAYSGKNIAAGYHGASRRS
jgi:superfamily II DNA or RNA helicase